MNNFMTIYDEITVNLDELLAVVYVDKEQRDDITYTPAYRLAFKDGSLITVSETTGRKLLGKLKYIIQLYQMPVSSQLKPTQQAERPSQL